MFGVLPFAIRVIVRTRIDEGAFHAIFLRAFFTELLERYSGLLAFVEQSRLEAKGRSPNLFLAYGAELRDAVQDLLGFKDPIENTIPGSDLQGLYNVFDYLSELSTRFQQLHLALRSFATPWPESAVSQFLAKLFVERSIDKDLNALHPTIVYSDEFNFLKYDLRDDLYLPPGSSAFAVWTLPKSEGTNPLFWPVLAHEIAHSLFSPDEAFEQIDFAIQKGFEKRRYAQLRHWSLELNADYFAYRLLGPAYVCCLVYFCAFFLRSRLRYPLSSDETEGGRDSFLAASHPPPRIRIMFLLNELKAITLTEGWTRAIAVIENIYHSRLRFDHEARDYEPDRDVMTFDPESRDLKALEEVWNAIKSTQMNTEVSRHGWTVNDLASSEVIGAQLGDGLLAASIGDKQKRTELRQSIEVLSAELEKGSPEDAERLLVEFSKYEKSLSLNERPAQMFEILNGGWFAKIEHMLTGRSLSEYSKAVVREPEDQLAVSVRHFKRF
jgi:hypothetical protein